MRPAYGILILSLSGFCGAIALPQQEAPLAEQQFKNIVSFKGNKASDVIPAMQFMSASLKVDCEYCHSADRAADDKDEKRTARAMIAMQRDINKKHFNGRNEITCATCHSGKTRPMSLPPLDGLEVRTRRSATVQAESAIAAFGKAVSPEGSKPIPGLRFEGTSLNKGEKSKVEATYMGEKYALVVHSKKGDFKTGFNGEMAYFPTEHGMVSVPKSIAVHYVNAKLIVQGADSLPKLSNATGGTAKLNGKDQVVVTGSNADRTRVSLFFDKSSGLLSRISYYYPTILGTMAEITDYSDYKKVNGTMIPMKIVNHDSEGDTVTEFKSAKVDSSLDAKAFEPPK